ncbi:MAG: PaaX family transcriptional regulator C-terminal domain-containing protein [Streptomyces sp.]
METLGLQHHRDGKVRARRAGRRRSRTGRRCGWCGCRRSGWAVRSCRGLPGPSAGASAVPRSDLRFYDWGRLLRTDPGLPAAHLEGDWPAERSARTFQRLEARLGPLADERLL